MLDYRFNMQIITPYNFSIKKYVSICVFFPFNLFDVTHVRILLSRYDARPALRNSRAHKATPYYPTL